MLQNTSKTLAFQKIMVYKTPPGGEVNHIWLVAYSHHKILVPRGPVAKEILIRLWILKPINSVGYKTLKNFFEVYDTDTPEGKLYQVWFYYVHQSQSHD